MPGIFQCCCCRVYSEHIVIGTTRELIKLRPKRASYTCTDQTTACAGAQKFFFIILLYLRKFTCSWHSTLSQLAGGKEQEWGRGVAGAALSCTVMSGGVHMVSMAHADDIGHGAVCCHGLVSCMQSVKSNLFFSRTWKCRRWSEPLPRPRSWRSRPRRISILRATFQTTLGGARPPPSLDHLLCLVTACFNLFVGRVGEQPGRTSVGGGGEEQRVKIVSKPACSRRASSSLPSL